MNYSKTIVCLANSRKPPSGRCVAGREILENRYEGWIRPVSARPTAEISLEERRYENGQEPEILDIVDIPMIAPVPKLHQTENHMIDPELYWTKTGTLNWADLPALVDTPSTLWLNGDSTHYGINNCVASAVTTQFTESLFLIRPHNLNVQVQVEGGMYGQRRRVRADFTFNGARYNFIVTDPVAEQAFLRNPNGVSPLNDVYLCISLTEAFSGDGRCHKLVATIIAEHPL